MARFDVYAHPDAVLRKKIPYLLDVQNEHLARIATRVVVPLRSAHQFDRPAHGLNPVFEIAGNQVVLDTAALAAFPASELTKPLVNLQRQAGDVVGALDILFGA